MKHKCDNGSISQFVVVNSYFVAAGGKSFLRCLAAWYISFSIGGESWDLVEVGCLCYQEQDSKIKEGIHRCDHLAERSTCMVCAS